MPFMIHSMRYDEAKRFLRNHKETHVYQSRYDSRKAVRIGARKLHRGLFRRRTASGDRHELVFIVESDDDMIRFNAMLSGRMQIWNVLGRNL